MAHGKSAAIFLIVLMTWRAGNASACPAYLAASGLNPLPVGHRESWRLFTLTTEVGATRLWSVRPLQVDPLDDQGLLMSQPAGETSLDQAPVSPSDRLVLRVETFGERAETKDGLPCDTERVYELRDTAHPERYAYLASCANATKPLEPGLVRYDDKHQRISSELFDYAYQANNQLVFDNLVVRDLARGTTHPAGANADILLRLDVKRFFTMELTNANVQSFVEASRSGPLGVATRIQFYLKLLFFKIDLKMATLASYYRDSANIPMVMDVPVDAPKRLHPGSGMLFNWLPEEARFDSKAARTAPLAEPKTIKTGAATLAEKGLAECHGDRCDYRLVGEIGARPFTIDMSVGRELVEKGFFPQWVPDVAAFKKEMGIGEGDATEKSRVAMYFETSGLPKGKYKMDYWIRMGETGEAEGTCPKVVDVTRVMSGSVAH